MGILSSITSLLTGQKRIRVSGQTSTRKKDNTYVARTSRNRQPNKRRGERRKRRSEKQQACNESFRGQRKFYKAFRVVVMLPYPAWDFFAEWMRRVAHTGDNCFHAINHKYMNGNEVGCPALFHFSRGELGMPWDMAVTRVGEVVMFTWHDDRDCPHARGSDRLLVGLLYDEYRDRPVLIDPHALRGHGAASITLDPKYGAVAHVYLFFERVDKRAYSDDQYFLS